VSTNVKEDFFSRLRSYSKELYSLDKRPLLDPDFVFPWDEIAEQLSTQLGISVKFFPQEPSWQENVSLKKDPSLFFFAIELPESPGELIISLNNADIATLLKQLISISPEEFIEQDPTFLAQFRTFLCSQLLAAAEATTQLKPLSPHIKIIEEPSLSKHLCREIKFQFDEHLSCAQIFISPELLESWRSSHTPQKNISIPQELSLPISIEAGRTFMTSQEIADVRVGDCLFIHHPFLIPQSERSRLFLTFRNQPLFRAKLKDGKIKILEMPLQHEAFMPPGGYSMAYDTPEKPFASEEPSEFEDFDLNTEEEEESTIGPDEEDLESSEEESEEFQEEFLEEDTIEEEPTVVPEEEPPQPSTSQEEAEEEPEPSEKDISLPKQTSLHLSQEPLRVEDIPLSVAIQLTELSMSVQELSSLQPGNLLDLSMRPEDGVSLIVNNRVFAVGELVMIGDHVGVHIKEIGCKVEQT